MTREELIRALYEPWGYDEPYDLIESAREQIEADGKRIAELEAAVRTLERSTFTPEGLVIECTANGARVQVHVEPAKRMEKTDE
jgi:hypothetical protein